MVMSDPIADMLTRIRNANQMKHESVDIPASKLKVELARILKDEGYIRDFRLVKEKGKPRETLRCFLKYTKENEKVITGLKRISKPGLRVYARKEEIPKVLGGLGVAILSTSKGVMSDKQARREGVGGEVICYVW